MSGLKKPAREILYGLKQPTSEFLFRIKKRTSDLETGIFVPGVRLPRRRSG